jgi:hypothetical protein
MKRFYKNKLNLGITPDPITRRKDILKSTLNHSDFLPNPLSYEDIDRAFKEWVENEMKVIQDGIELPTMILFSNQRFSEYMQTWQYTDENNNVRLNFKTITRENNPNHGTIVGDTYNIPGDRYYTLNSIQAIDESGKKYRIDYKVKQPTPVDFRYKVSLMTNRYVTLNQFNELIHSKFNALQAYISPNGHYMSMQLETISDESEYNISDRQFFSQSFNVLLKGYIINEKDFRIEENPIAANISFGETDGKRPRPTIELSEYDPCLVENVDIPYYKKDIDIDIDVSYCFPKLGNIVFTMDENFTLTGITFLNDNNIVTQGIKLFINDTLISHDLVADAFEGYVPLSNVPEDATSKNTLNCNDLPREINNQFKYLLIDDVYYKWHEIIFHDGDEIKVKTNRINRHKKDGFFTLHGYSKITIHKENELSQEQIMEYIENEKIKIE